ncbi:hypothetical protein [Treponema bryantii]|nr:hypothetical protein [Treponema bryantii]
MRIINLVENEDMFDMILEITDSAEKQSIARKVLDMSEGDRKCYG